MYMSSGEMESHFCGYDEHGVCGALLRALGVEIGRSFAKRFSKAIPLSKSKKRCGTRTLHCPEHRTRSEQ
jgi:hypothetical protein